MKRQLIVSLAIALMLVLTLSLPAVAADESTVSASVTVSSFISITITDSGAAGIQFGSLAPGTTGNLDTSSNDTTPSIILRAGRMVFHEYKERPF
ncbi:MAG: hypothetical protein ABIH46_00840 [Chloroflexota bacterium]